MNTKLVAALCGALVLVLCGCPGGNGGNDAGPTPTDGGVIGTGGCSGGCGPNLVCNEATHQCEPGCNPACAEGQLCVKMGDTFSCQTPQTTCSGNVCGDGQTTCLSGNCSCLPINRAARDTCASHNEVCHAAYNPATQSGGECESPNLYEFCGTGCSTGGNCGSCAPGSGAACDDTLTGSYGVCMRTCTTQTECGKDELCSSSGFCYPSGVFNGFTCQKRRPASDGGTELYRVSAPDTCITLSAQAGGPTNEDPPTGTCTWTFIRSDTDSFPITYCRTAGPVPEFGACKTDVAPKQTTGSCATGLECAPTNESGDGICLRICNAQTVINGATGEPGCNMGEACANIYRRDDNNIVGACMMTCNVFSSAANFGCDKYGTKDSSCVPTSASGVQLVTASGNGLCIVQRPNPKGEGETCEETDPLKGAACQSGLICTQLPGAAQPSCVKPCDVECVPGDGGPVPMRCSTEANATCSGGKSCTRVNGSSGATLGFCE